MTTALKRKRIIKMNAISYGKLVAAMLDGTLTKHELADHTGLHYSTICQYTRELHLQGAAHIDHWEKDSYGRDSMPVFRIGRGKDAKRFKMTAADRTRRTRAKKASLELISMMAGGNANAT
jgi:hypothetical protein